MPRVADAYTQVDLMPYRLFTVDAAKELAHDWHIRYPKGVLKGDLCVLLENEANRRSSSQCGIPQRG